MEPKEHLSTHSNTTVMSIIYDWFENPKRREEEETTLHVRPCFNGTVSTKTLVRCIQERCSLTSGDVLAVLTELNDVLGNELREGRQVHITGLGYFAPTLTVEGRVTPDMPLRERNRKVRFKGVSFRMDKELRQSIGPTRMAMTRWESHSQVSTAQEQKRKLTEYFSQHDFLTRRDLQFLLGLKKSTAVSLLRQWRQAGLLLNKGTDRQPIYVPAPGCFGR